MDKWAIIVVRNNGKDVDVLPQLCDSRDEAFVYAQHNGDRWQGVTMEVVKVFVPLQGEPVTAPKD